MKTILSTLQAYGRYLLNKAAAIALLLFLMWQFVNLPGPPKDADGNVIGPAPEVPFSELLYVGIMILAVVVVAPLLRLLVFPEAAEYAESDQLRTDLKSTYRPPALLHYWFATSVSYLVTAACLASLSH